MAAWWDVPSLIANDDLPPLPPRLALLAGLAGPMPLAEYEAAHGPWSWPDPSELPEVARLARDGWHLPDPHAVNLVVPFAWPAVHRGWLPNRVPHVWLSQDRRLIPPTAEDEEFDSDPTADELGALGIDVSPDRRIWLLRSRSRPSQSRRCSTASSPTPSPSRTSAAWTCGSTNNLSSTPLGWSSRPTSPD